VSDIEKQVREWLKPILAETSCGDDVCKAAVAYLADIRTGAMFADAAARYARAVRK
jgi:hypothetical protein